MSLQSVSSELMTITRSVETESLQAIVSGFSFAAAIAWMDLVRWVISELVTTPKNGASYYALSALATTLVAVLVFAIVSMVNKNIKQPQPVYAVTGL